MSVMATWVAEREVVRRVVRWSAVMPEDAGGVDIVWEEIGVWAKVEVVYEA